MNIVFSFSAKTADKGTNNFVNACYPPLNNVNKKKIVSDEKISTMNFGLLT